MFWYVMLYMYIHNTVWWWSLKYGGPPNMASLKSPWLHSSGRLKSSDWSADSAAKLLWSLARYGKGEEILKHRQVAPRGRGSRGSRFREVLGFTLILGKSGKNEISLGNIDGFHEQLDLARFIYRSRDLAWSTHMKELATSDQIVWEV